MALLALVLAFCEPAFCQPVFAAPGNKPPVISGMPPTNATVGVAYAFQPVASDPEGRALTFSVINRPPWAVFNSQTGLLSGKPTVAGTHSNIRISVSDQKYTASLPVFTIVVAAASGGNRPPVISGTPAASVTVGQAYSFTPTASDPDGQTLTFSIANKPSWAAFSTTTGRLSGTPTAAGASSGISIAVSDGAASASLPSFSITAQAVANRPPVISGTPVTSVTVGQAYGFTPTASDPDGQTLTFSIANKPAWAAFSTTSGRLSGTPTAAGVSSGISIAVSDGALSASLASFSINAQAVANRPPVIGGTPVTHATAGQTYSFRPTASDADGNALTFSISGKPAWATFDSSNGTLYGTPISSGTFANIVIGVSDGKASVSLPAFAIVVAASQTTSATVSWKAPTTNSNGTPITGLTGYRVYAGTSPGQYSQNVAVQGPGVTSVVLAGLASGNVWYFVVTAVNSAGLESPHSQEVSVNRL